MGAAVLEETDRITDVSCGLKLFLVCYEVNTIKFFKIIKTFCMDILGAGGGGSSGYATPTNELSAVFTNFNTSNVLSVDNVVYSTVIMNTNSNGFPNPGYIQLTY